MEIPYKIHQLEIKSFQAINLVFFNETITIFGRDFSTLINLNEYSRNNKISTRAI